MNYSKYNRENLVAARRIFITAAFVLFAMFRIMPLAAAPRVSEQRQALITYALKLQGTPYVYGGDSPENGMDCSGFVTYVAANSVGVQLPRTAHSLYTATKRIKPQEREPGDLVFFKNDPASERITHVGIYCGVYHGKNRAQGQRSSHCSHQERRDVLLLLRGRQCHHRVRHQFSGLLQEAQGQDVQQEPRYPHS